MVLSYISHVQEDTLRYGKQNLKFIDILQILTRNGLDVNLKDSNRHTALHLLASYPGHFDIIKVLLASGAKANLQVMLLFYEYIQKLEFFHGVALHEK